MILAAILASRKQPLPIKLFPPEAGSTAAGFLRDYYASLKHERSMAEVVGHTLLRLALAVWLPFRTFQVALWDRRSFRWCLSTVSYSAVNFTDPLEVSLFGLPTGSSAEFMRRFELGGVMQTLNPAGWEPGCVLNDKELFRLHCERNGLPCPTWFATTGGRFKIAAHEPNGDVILKPIVGKGGKGVRLANYAQGLFYEGSYRGITYQQLLERLSSQGAGYIVQRREHNHPVLARFRTAALSTARMTTCLNEGGHPELVASYMRMALHRHVIVDNISAGGLIAAIDPATGILNEAMVGKFARPVALHPLSGTPIQGTQLPFWEEAKNLVTKAHVGLQNKYTCIAWDVAFTGRGPILVEGNTKPCIIIQRATRVGLGTSRFGELIKHHLQRRQSTRLAQGTIPPARHPSRGG